MSRHDGAAWAAKVADRDKQPERPGRRTLAAICADDAATPIGKQARLFEASGIPEFSAFCPGIPQTQGGTVPFRSKSGITVQVTRGSKALPAWRKSMTKAFALQNRLSEPLDGPLLITQVFVIPTTKEALRPKHGGALRPYKRWDGDKLTRACWDSLVKAGVVVDDSRFCEWRGIKRYATLTDTPGVLVRIWKLGEAAKMETAAQSKGE